MRASERSTEEVIEKIPEKDSVGVADDTVAVKDLVTHFVRASRHRGVEPPRKIVGHVAREAALLANEGVDGERLIDGIDLLVERGLNPATLASVVYEAARGRQSGAKPDQILSGEWRSPRALAAARTQEWMDAALVREDGTPYPAIFSDEWTAEIALLAGSAQSVGDDSDPASRS